MDVPVDRGTARVELPRPGSTGSTSSTARVSVLYKRMVGILASRLREPEASVASWGVRPGPRRRSGSARWPLPPAARSAPRRPGRPAVRGSARASSRPPLRDRRGPPRRGRGTSRARPGTPGRGTAAVDERTFVPSITAITSSPASVLCTSSACATARISLRFRSSSSTCGSRPFPTAPRSAATSCRGLSLDGFSPAGRPGCRPASPSTSSTPIVRPSNRDSIPVAT